MRQALLVVDIQPSFSPPAWLIRDVGALAATLPSVATIERHDEQSTPFERQLGWKPAPSDESLVKVDKVFVKHGYLPSQETIAYLRTLNAERILVCGIQADTCVLAAGFALFDAGLRPTLLSWLTVGSSVDPSAELGIKLWRHHFREVLSEPAQL